MKPILLILTMLVVTSCSNKEPAEVIVNLEASEHEHPHEHEDLEKRIKQLEDRPQVIYQGQEAEAIKELLKQSPYIKL